MRNARLWAGWIALAGVGMLATAATAQPTNGGVVPANANGASPKIGVINLALVLKKFDQANYLGDTLLAEAQKEETALKTQRAELQKKEAEIQTIPNKKDQEDQAKILRQMNTQLQEKEIDARKRFAEKQAEMAKDVYKKIMMVIDTVAKTYGHELIITYPDATTPEESDSPAQAFRVLSAQGAMIVWKNQSLDITETVIKYLNHNFKAPADYKPTSRPLPVGTTK